AAAVPLPATQSPERLAPASAAGQPIFITYDVKWWNKDLGQFGFELTVDTNKSLSQSDSFIPPSGTDKFWSLELQWDTPDDVPLTIDEFSSSAGTFESSDSHPNFFALTYLNVANFPITYRLNLNAADSALATAKSSNITRFLRPSDFRAYDSSKPSGSAHSLPLEEGVQVIVDSRFPKDIRPVNLDTLATEQPAAFTKLSRKANESFDSVTQTGGGSAITQTAHFEKAAEVDDSGNSEAINPYGTVLMEKPVGLYLYSAIVGVGALFYIWGYIYRILCRRHLKGAQGHAQYFQ
ncbi:hypothetical protein H4R33_006816, partial [Dimargaris cristalligena]